MLAPWAQPRQSVRVAWRDPRQSMAARPVSHQPRSAAVPVTVGPPSAPTAQSSPRSVARTRNGPGAGVVDGDGGEQLPQEVVGPVGAGVRRAQVDVVDLHLASPRRHDGRRRPLRSARETVDRCRASVLLLEGSTASANEVVAASSPVADLGCLRLRPAPSMSASRCASEAYIGTGRRCTSPSMHAAPAPLRSAPRGPPRALGSIPAATTARRGPPP